MSLANEISEQVLRELERAQRKFPAFHSSHEGYAVLKEEVDELWDAVKSNNVTHAKVEAIQVAAMAIRFILETPAEPRS